MLLDQELEDRLALHALLAPGEHLVAERRDAGLLLRRALRARAGGATRRASPGPAGRPSGARAARPSAGSRPRCSGSRRGLGRSAAPARPGEVGGALRVHRSPHTSVQPSRSTSGCGRFPERNHRSGWEMQGVRSSGTAPVAQDGRPGGGSVWVTLLAQVGRPWVAQYPRPRWLSIG